MVNTAWSLKELAKYPPALVVFFGMVSIMIFQERQKSGKDDQLEAKNKELIVCKESYANIISALKDEKFQIVELYRRKQDSLLVEVQANKNIIRQIKKKIR